MIRKLLASLAAYHEAHIGDARLWSGRRPGIHVEIELRNLWRGHLWHHPEERRFCFGWGDGYQHEAFTVWVRYWLVPVEQAKRNEEVPF